MAELSQRPFEEITVQQICERAMVHRSTFYKHYENKYALLEQGIRQMYDELVAEEEHLPPYLAKGWSTPIGTRTWRPTPLVWTSWIGSLTDQVGAIFPLALPVAPYGW